jgi:glutamate--cysteine ligase
MYNQLVEEFAQLVGFDPFLLNVKTQVFENFDMSDLASKEKLAAAVDQMIAELKVEYAKRGIQQEPFLFVKNNSGTYGLAVARVGSGKEVLSWNNRSRTKMKAAKGGREVEEVIIQEGISSVVTADAAAAEPVIYMIGCELAGGFLRTHAEKGSTDSLNSPGAVYKKLCVSDLTKSLEGSPLENVYGWSAKLGMLAIGLEAKEMGVEFKGFLNSACKTLSPENGFFGLSVRGRRFGAKKRQRLLARTNSVFLDAGFCRPRVAGFLLFLFAYSEM